MLNHKFQKGDKIKLRSKTHCSYVEGFKKYLPHNSIGVIKLFGEQTLGYVVYFPDISISKKSIYLYENEIELVPKPYEQLEFEFMRHD